MPGAFVFEAGRFCREHRWRSDGDPGGASSPRAPRARCRRCRSCATRSAPSPGSPRRGPAVRVSPGALSAPGRRRSVRTLRRPALDLSLRLMLGVPARGADRHSGSCSDAVPTTGTEEATMAKVGRFVIDPKAGAYCQITLDSGEKIIVNHDKGGFKGGRLTIEVSRLMGFSSERIFTCDLDSPEGAAALGRLTGCRAGRRGHAAGGVREVRQRVPVGVRREGRLRVAAVRVGDARPAARARRRLARCQAGRRGHGADRPDGRARRAAGRRRHRPRGARARARVRGAARPGRAGRADPPLRGRPGVRRPRPSAGGTAGHAGGPGGRRGAVRGRLRGHVRAGLSGARGRLRGRHADGNQRRHHCARADRSWPTPGRGRAGGAGGGGR